MSVRACVCVVDLSRDEGSARRSLAHAVNGSNTVTITRAWFRAVLQGESACVCLPHIAVYGAAVFVDVGLDGEGEERETGRFTSCNSHFLLPDEIGILWIVAPERVLERELPWRHVVVFSWVRQHRVLSCA